MTTSKILVYILYYRQSKKEIFSLCRAFRQATSPNRNRLWYTCDKLQQSQTGQGENDPMSDFILKFDQLNGTTEKFRDVSSSLTSAQSELITQARRLSGMSGFGIPQIQAAIIDLGRDLARLGSDTNDIASFVDELQSIVTNYENKAVIALGGEVDAFSQQNAVAATEVNVSSVQRSMNSGFNWWQNIDINETGGISWRQYELINFERGNLSLDANAYLLRQNYGVTATPTSFNAFGSFSLFESHANLNYRMLDINASGYLGRVYGNAQAGLNFGEYVSTWEWCKDTNAHILRERFVYAGVGASARAYASVASGSVNASLGNHVLGQNVGASATALGANAHAGARLELSSAGINAYLEAGAKAYLANAGVTSEINFMGLQVSGNVRGYAGSVGGTKRAGIRDEGIYIGASLSALLGLGFDLNLSFDPNEFRSAVTTITTTANDVWST